MLIISTFDKDGMICLRITTFKFNVIYKYHFFKTSCQKIIISNNIYLSISCNTCKISYENNVAIVLKLVAWIFHPPPKKNYKHKKQCFYIYKKKYNRIYRYFMRKSRKKLSIWISYSLRLFHERPIVIAVRWRAHVLWRHLSQQTSIVSIGCFINYSSINHSFHYSVGNKM